MDKKSIFGLNENYVSALSYIGLFVSGLIIYILEKDNKTVRFNALQSTVFFILAFILTNLIGVLPILGGLISGILNFAIIVSYLFLVYTAYKGVMYKIPFIGDIVYDQINK